MITEEIKQIKKWLGTGSINFFGPPFSGKDTQAQILAELFEGRVIGSGEILRSDISPDHVKSTINSGQLAPTLEYRQLVLPFLSQSKFNNMPLLLSAIGRWDIEVEDVVNATDSSGHPIKAVVWIQLDEPEVWRRYRASLQKKDRGVRADDKPGSIKVRLQDFEEKTMQVIEIYKQKGLLIEVKGNQEAVKVSSEIIDKLALKSKE